VQPARLYGEIILENTSVTPEQLEKALKVAEETGEQLGKVLVNMGAITEKERVMCLGKRWGISFVELEDVRPEPDVLQSIPEGLLRKHKCFPMAKNSNRITLAMAAPNDIYSIDDIRLTTGYDVDPVLAAEEDILKAIDRATGSDSRVGELIDEYEKTQGEIDTLEAHETQPGETSAAQLSAAAEEAPVIRLADMIINQAIREGATDIHIQPEENKVRCRMRIDGTLHDMTPIPKSAQPALISRFKIMADLAIDEKRRPQDGRISRRSAATGKVYDFRVSTLPASHGEKVVLRVLEKGTIMQGMASLGFSSKMLEKFEDLIARPWGIVLVTGPTGSGKSTTLYAALNTINSPEVNIVTIEDPVEYQLRGITQVPVDVRADRTFANALRAFLRQDPDIIMVGEIRDKETAVIATEAALTGHLVFSTLHTNNAPSAVTRLIEMQVEPFLISSTVIGVLAQRLVKMICARCKSEFEPPETALQRLGLSEHGGISFYKGKGCDYCRHTGYKGRCGIFELMMVTDEIRDLILRERPAHEIEELAIGQGMVSLRQDAIQKVTQGVTTIEEALTKVYGGR
jgi:type IV pilus assembly protein PilB